MLEFITHPNEPAATPRRIKVKQRRFKSTHRIRVTVIRTY